MKHSVAFGLFKSDPTFSPFTKCSAKCLLHWLVYLLVLSLNASTISLLRIFCYLTFLFCLYPDFQSIRHWSRLVLPWWFAIQCKVRFALRGTTPVGASVEASRLQCVLVAICEQVSALSRFLFVNRYTPVAIYFYRASMHSDFSYYQLI